MYEKVQSICLLEVYLQMKMNALSLTSENSGFFELTSIVR